MALPIACTPVLRGKTANDFITRIRREETDRKPLVPTPDLESVCQAIIADASKKKK
jgi:hypothetical protein